MSDDDMRDEERDEKEEKMVDLPEGEEEVDSDDELEGEEDDELEDDEEPALELYPNGEDEE